MGGPRLVQWSRFSDAFGRLFGLQGGTALNVIDDVFLTLPVEPELLHLNYLRGWTAFAAPFAAIAVVGQLSHGRIQNPAGTNRLVVVEGFSAYCPAGAQPIAVGTLVSTSFAPGAANRDRRGPTPTGGLGVITTANPATALATVYARFLPPQGPINMQLVLPPGLDLAVECQTANTAVEGFIFGQYRELTPQEL